MKKLLIALTFMAMSSLTMAHSGGTDSEGCHAGTQPKHCH